MTADVPAPDPAVVDVDALRKVAESATSGEWWFHAGTAIESRHACSPSHRCRGVADTSATSLPQDEDRHRPQARRDAEYIATFDPPTVLALLDEVERTRAEVADTRDPMSQMAQHYRHEGRQEALGKCPASGLTQRDCKASICDCFTPSIDDLIRERDEARAEVERLRATESRPESVVRAEIVNNILGMPLVNGDLEPIEGRLIRQYAARIARGEAIS